jgi:tripartite-type tricarboxylate transporter receptor subunit TctC
MSLRWVVLLFCAGWAMAAMEASHGQGYPNKPVRIVTYAPGGSNDLAARLIAQGISAPLGQSVIVDNRGGGFVPIETVKNSPADGYTLLVAGVIYTIGPLLQTAPYDPVRDFEPISMLGNSPLVLVVHPSLPVKSVKELIALAKARPGQLNYATGGIGGATHLATELFTSMAGGLKLVQINYRTGGPAVNGLIGGECQLMFATASTVSPHITSGRLRALGVTSTKRSALAPDLATIASTGLPGFESAQFSVIVAPAKTPAAIVSRLNQEVARVLTQPDVKQKFLAAGVEAEPSTPQELTTALKGEITKMGKIIKDAGIKAE